MVVSHVTLEPARGGRLAIDGGEGGEEEVLHAEEVAR